MILNGNQRGGARDLARHLIKPENEHIEIHQIRGFVANTLVDALREAEAVSRGTKCRQFLYSLSLSPPETAAAPVALFENAIDKIEAKLGLAGQPRVIVFHEKQGRRHAHCVWSRINSVSMTAVRMSHDHKKLTDISRDLFFEHGWKMPEGLIDPELSNPLNFDRREWFEAKRAGKDPRDIKKVFQQCWAASDSGKALRQALEQRGYYLAQGDQRAAVAIDVDGEVYSVVRWTGVRNKEVAARIGDLAVLPIVDRTQARITTLVREKRSSFEVAKRDEFARAADELEARRIAMVQRHSTARAELDRLQDELRIIEAKQRAHRFRKGLLGLWDRVTGKCTQLRRQNELEIEAARQRDAAQKDELVHEQLSARQQMQQEIRRMRGQEVREISRMQKSPHGLSAVNRKTDRQIEAEGFIRARRRRERQAP
jgi:hypothetical protein